MPVLPIDVSEDASALLVERVPRLVGNPGCSLCPLGRGDSKFLKCIPGSLSQEKGGVLCVVDAPTHFDARNGQFGESEQAQRIGDILSKALGLPVSWVTAVKCSGRSSKGTLAPAVNACRSYLADEVARVEPSLVLAFGRWAWLALTGRSVDPRDVRGAWARLFSGAPAWCLQSLEVLSLNRFWGQELRDDLNRIVRHRDPEPVPSKAPEFLLVESLDEAEQVVEDLELLWNSNPASALVVDTETTGRPNQPDFEVRTLGLSWAWARWPAVVWDYESLGQGLLLRSLRRFFRRFSPRIVAHNIQFDLHGLEFLGLTPYNLHGCTLTAHKLLYSYSLGKLDMLQEIVGRGGGKLEVAREKRQLAAKIRKLPLDAGEVDKAQIGDPACVDAIRSGLVEADAYLYGLINPVLRSRYCAGDVYSTRLLYQHQNQLPEWQEGQPARRSWEVIQRPVLAMLWQVGRWGFQLNQVKLQRLIAELRSERDRGLEQLQEIAEINWGSPKQLGEFLFGRLGLKVVRLTDSGSPSTDADTLETLRDAHPAVARLLAVRDVSKVLDYALSLVANMDLDGRVHTSFDVVGAESGRISSREPNLQNCPKNEWGKKLRECFEPGVDAEGHKWILLQLDYSQIELRVAADITQDPNMMDIFEQGVDYHLRTAQLVAQKVWGIAPETLTKKSPERDKSKTLNFGLLYGMGDKMLAQRMGSSVQVATLLREQILGSAFKKLGVWMKEQLREVIRTGKISTYYDGQVMRQRDLSDIALPQDGFGGRVSTAKNGAGNTPIQGSANYLNLKAAVEVVDWIQEEKIPARLVNLVHDSMVLEVREDWAREVAERVKSFMLAQPMQSVALGVDVERGDTWASLEKWEL